MTARRSPTDYPTLRAIAASRYDPFGEESFDQRITLLLSGIAGSMGCRLSPSTTSVQMQIE